MGDKKQKKNKKQRRNARSKAVGEISKRGQLPSSVQALLGYLGGGGPTPMYQQPVNIQKERAGVDSMETLSQIIRQQNMMNMSYMQNMEKLAFKNEMQEQLKKQGEKNQEEIKQQSQEQKKEQAKANQALQETAEISIQQQRVSLMRKLSYEAKHKNRTEKIQSLQEQLEILDGSIRNSKVSDLRSSLLQVDPKLAQRTSMPSTPYMPPIGTNSSIASWLMNQTPSPSVQPSTFRYGTSAQKLTPLFQQSPMFQVDTAPVDNITQVLPAIDRNRQDSFALQNQLTGDVDELFKVVEEHIAKTKKGRQELSAQQELKRNMTKFAFIDATSSSGAYPASLDPQGKAGAYQQDKAGASAGGKIASSFKIARTP